MPALVDLIAPQRCAVLTMELQRGITGDLAVLSQLRDALITHGVIDAAAATCRSARAAGVRVVHCTAVTRPDTAGRKNNSRLQAATADLAEAFQIGSPGAEIMPELEPAAADIEVSRLHGLTAFTGTALDQTLRNLGITTVVVVGNSLNVGVLGTVLSAVDLGYQVVVPTDAVAGLPLAYAEAVIEHTVSLLATLTTSTELTRLWSDLV